MTSFAYRDDDGWINLVEDGVVTTLPSEDGDTPAHTRLAAFLDGGGEIADAPPPPPPPTTEQLAAYAADKRWRVETGGLAVATDDRSKIMIIGARVKANSDPGFTTEWKTGAGFVTIDAATIIAISDAVQAHVAACFAAEAAVLAEIEGETITGTAEIDAADWPQS